MTHLHVERSATVAVTGRLAVAAAGMDHPVTDTTTTVIEVDVPLDEQPWTVGLIIGPSGSGKTTVARELWPWEWEHEPDWPDDRAVIDAFPDTMTASEVTGLLTRVGLGSVPAWLRPYRALSNGEQFRARMARALAEADHTRPVVVDEFTSVVDRQVGQVVSHTVAKAARARKQQFVAVTCHYDVEDWLQPDWVLDVAARSFTWRSVQPRPRVTLDVYPVPVGAWRLFRDHHYLSHVHLSSGKCFVAFADGDRPVAFASYIHLVHPKVRNIKMTHRLVVLPDWQGVGIARELQTHIGELVTARGFRYRSAVAHPAMKHMYATSPRWRMVTRSMGWQHNKSKISGARHQTMRQGGISSFEYQPMRATAGRRP